MTLPEQIFRAYDIRGLVATELTADLMELLGRAVGAQALEQGADRIAVGRDGRLTGPELVAALCRGLLASGCDVLDIGAAPTPALWFAAARLAGGCGAQVTGSHNPPPYNGLKLMLSGTTLAGPAIQDLKQRVAARDFRAGRGQLSKHPILPAYHRAIAADITLARPLKVALDCGNGIAGACAPQIFRAIGCEVVELFCEVDGNFPNHHPDPSRPENLRDLCAAVKAHGADFGLAFDGDGDRLGVVTARGDIVWPDRQMLLFAAAVLERQPGAEIIYDVKCTQLLPKTIAALGGRPVLCQTGHSFMKAKLKERGAPLAGEMSGHIFFNDRWGGFDDGIYAGCRLCELIAAQDRPAQAVFDQLPDTVNTPELRLELTEGDPPRLVRALAGAANFPAAEVNTLDGVRADFPNGFGLVRASNTTPTVIMRFEADNEDNLRQIQEQFRALFERVRPGLELPF